MNRGIFGLSNQAANGLGVLTAPGQSVGLYARFVPWLAGYPNNETSQSTAFSPRPYVVIGADPTIFTNNVNTQFTGLALQLPNIGSAFVTIPANPDANYAGQANGVAVGAARGQAAVDLQTYRTISTQVASGQFSTAVGQANIASGTQAAAFGYTNNVSGSNATALGNNSTASNTQTTAVGYLNTASGTQASAFGYNCSASNTFAVAAGTQCTATLSNSASFGIFASSPFAYAISLSASRFATNGDSQLIFARQSFRTTTATATQLFGDDTSGTTRLSIALSTSYAYKLQLVARQTGGTAGTAGDTAIWHIEGGVYRAAAGNTTLLGAVQTSYVAVTAAAAWTATVSADTVNQALVVTVAGEANKNINWVAFWTLTRNA